MNRSLSKIVSTGMALVAGLALNFGSVKEAKAEDYINLNNDLSVSTINYQSSTEPSASYDNLRVGLNLPEDARQLNMVKIPAGTFLMGNNGTERDGSVSDELPQHLVTITKDFYIGDTEITQAQYFSIIGVQPSNNYGVGDNYPAYYISWNDTQNFISELNSLSQKKFRLPTEAEWEYACRGSELNRERYNTFSFGDDLSINLDNCDLSSLFDENMVYCGNEKITARKVASNLPNDYGLFDMHGNMWEWVQDYYDPNFYSKPAALLPNPINTTPGSALMRGGSWTHNPKGCRSAVRSGISADTSHNVSGFRLAIDSSEINSPTETEINVPTRTFTPTYTPTETFTETPTLTPTYTQIIRPTRTPTPIPTNPGRVAGYVFDSANFHPVELSILALDGEFSFPDENGMFKFRNVPLGEHNIYAVSVGYEPYENNIRVTPATPFLIELLPRGTNPNADFNFDGKVDGNDLIELKNNWYKEFPEHKRPTPSVDSIDPRQQMMKDLERVLGK